MRVAHRNAEGREIAPVGTEFHLARLFRRVSGHRNLAAQQPGLPHIDPHRAVLKHLRADDAAFRAELEFVAAGEHSPFDVESDAARRVAAHFGFGPVGIVDAHLERIAGKVADRHHAVGSDSEMTVAKPLDRAADIEGGGLGKLGQDEIIAESVPL